MKTTNCIVCGRAIQYTTKKPYWCPECKAEKGNKNSTKATQSPKSKWKSESHMYKVIRELLPNIRYCINGYYSFLPSPKGEPMQLDWYSEGIRLAFEFQGQQHYRYVQYISKSKKNFNYLQECDRLKKNLCLRENITLIEVRYDYKVTTLNLARLIKNQNPQLFEQLLSTRQLKLTESELKELERDPS